MEDTRFPPEVKVKKGYSWSDELGIAIAALAEAGQKDLVEWVVRLLTDAINRRERLVREVDAKDDDGEEGDAARLKSEPSAEAISKFVDFCKFSL